MSKDQSQQRASRRLLPILATLAFITGLGFATHSALAQRAHRPSFCPPWLAQPACGPSRVVQGFDAGMGECTSTGNDCKPRN